MNRSRLIKTEKYGDEFGTASPPQWAEDTLRRVADLAEASLQPPPRAQATARTLREIAGLLPEKTFGLAPMDVVIAMSILGEEREAWQQPRGPEDPRVTARRRTCTEISHAVQQSIRGFVGSMPSDTSALIRYACMLHVVIELWESSTDARLAAVADTSLRELGELCAFGANDMPAGWATLPDGWVERAIARAKREGVL